MPMTDRSWLIQRLRKPLGDGLLNVFAFGGGLLNGGLSKDAMNLLRDIFEFDYMGAAEFEFGAVPEALKKMAGSELEAFKIEWPLAEVEAPWQLRTTIPPRRPRKGTPKPLKQAKVKAGDPEPTAVVYAIAPKEWHDDVIARIKGVAAPYSKENPFRQQKSSPMLCNTLRPYSEYDTKTVGWLELDNGFMFFTDKEMFEKTAKLFGVKVEE